ncbi:uncharacterized protein LOC135341140 [Halichondria panicea]|uniref:uncharacterized protein LOC135341140 n=1 Tax=Halichondria panicea TaxID=6063 RepID=UPI00312B7C2A
MDQDILGQQLLRACRHGDVDEVKRLLEEGAPVSWTNWSGSTALGTACCCDRADVIKVLVEYKADINEQTSNGLTPLHIACTLGKMESVRALVSTGKCKLRVLNSYGRTPLGEAVFWNKLSIVEHMINACNIGINDTVTKWGDTALGLAVRQEKLDIVKYFISRFSMNINVPVTRWGDTLMELTIREQKLDILKYLISECIVNVNTPINDFEETPLLLAARGGKLSVIKFLISECGADVNDKLLLLASKYGHTEMVSYLLIMHHLNPNFKDVNGQTPLVLARKKDVIQLLLQHGAVALDVYTEYRKTLGKVFSKDPLKNLAKMFVIGRSGEGKSTLIEAIEHEPTVLESLVNVFISRREVDGVSLKTAGIIPRTFKSRFFGQVVMYDFAGQDAYYSSHAAIIKSAVDTCSPIIVLVVGLHRDDTTITHSVSYWLGIIANQCANLDGKAPLIVVGSHADLVTDMATVDRKEQLILRTAQRFSIFNLVKCVRMDCRYSNSTSMRAFRRYIGTCCSTIQSKWSVSLNSHMLLVYMLDKFAGSIAITLEELCANIKTSQELSKEIDFLSFVPTTIPRLIDICTQLSDKGHILFLHNTLSPDTSFIVIDTAKLLAEINGTIFAPEDFTQHCEMSTSTGVVSLSKLATHFANLHIEMLIGFLSHLELAVPIEDNEILSLIDQHFSST